MQTNKHRFLGIDCSLFSTYMLTEGHSGRVFIVPSIKAGDNTPWNTRVYCLSRSRCLETPQNVKRTCLWAMARGFSIYLACCQLMPVEFWDGFVLFVK